MKKNTLAILSCFFVLTVIHLGSAAKAQATKGLTRSIIINNGDTLVNGKKFDELDKDEKTKLRKEFKDMEHSFRGLKDGNDSWISHRKGATENKVIKRREGKGPNILFWNDKIGDDLEFNFDYKTPEDLRVFKFNGDSNSFFGYNADTLMKGFNFKIDSNLKEGIITMHRNMVPRGHSGNIMRRELMPFNFETQAFPGFGERNNSSSFSYDHTDKDGISSHMNIRISDADKEQLKKITGTETATKSLEVNDLTLFPNFSSGKMTLSFNTNNKGNTRISVLDSDFKRVFADDAANLSGNYVKQISLPKNGVYYVTISQNGSWFIKKLIKE